MALILLPSMASPVAADGDSSAAVDRAVAQLPALTEQMMQQTGVPGVAVAVVHNDRLVYSQGFGVRDSAGGAPVTAQTVFQVASVSKPVGASAVAAAIGKGGLRWDDPVVEHIPAFRLRSRWVSRKVTIGDMYAHRSGLPGETGNDLESFGIPVSQIIQRMRYVPLNPFRDSYSYSNFGLTVGARAAAASRDQTWPAMTRQLLFEPLGMRHSSYRHKDFLKRSNRAALHQQVKGRWVSLSKRNPDAQAPAGGLSSSVEDLAKWLRMELADGRFDGRRVVAAKPLSEARSLQIRTSEPGEDATLVRGYAFGMDVGTDDAGNVRWTHSGAFTAGASTRIAMLPAYDVGIVVLTNAWMTGLPEALVESFFDLVERGTVSRDWLSQMAQMFGMDATPNRAAFDKAKPVKPEPAARLSRYSGVYRNDYMGAVRVRRKHGHLILLIGNSRRILRHWTGNTFAYQLPDLPPGFVAGVRFRMRHGTSVAVNCQEVSYGLGSLGIARRRQ